MRVPKIVVVWNPVAGRGAHLWPRYEAELRRRGCCLYATQKMGDAARLTREAIEEGAQIVVAAGGDGTLGEVVGAIIESGEAVTVGVLPMGTGNDFARTLGVWGQPKQALDAIFEGNTRRVDVGQIECEGIAQFFVNVAGSGFDALVAKRINEWGHRPALRHARGVGAYLLAVAREMTTFRSFDLALELDGERIETGAVLVAVANAKSYGGGMLVCPHARLDDGLFDVCVIQSVSRTQFLRAFPGVFAGKHVSHPRVMMRRCRSIRIESEQNIPILADGEIIGHQSQGNTAFECHILPTALAVRAPRLTNESALFP